MEVRRSEYKDVDDIMNIINEGKNYFKSKGIDQWQKGYPNHDLILDDIVHHTSYVLVDNDKIIGTMRFAIEEDPDYGYIEGNWLNHDKYGVIHRIAVSDAQKGNGYANILVNYAKETCKLYGAHSLRIDTHEKNVSMQRLIHKNGFIECGVVYIQKTEKRIAYEYLIQ